MASKQISRSEFLGGVLALGGALEQAIEAVQNQAGEGDQTIAVAYAPLDKYGQEIFWGQIRSASNSFEEAKKLGSALKTTLEVAIDFGKAPLGLRVSAVKNARGVYIKVCFPKWENLI